VLQPLFVDPQFVVDAHFLLNLILTYSMEALFIPKLIGMLNENPEVLFIAGNTERTVRFHRVHHILISEIR
jgi:hypothetical protein